MLGKGSHTNDWELRYSLRSFFLNYQCQSQAWVIGHCPAWLDTSMVRHIDWPDPYQVNKDANLLNKAIRLAFERELSERFIFCSDDHFLIRASGPEDFLHWHCGEIPLSTTEDKNSWHQRLVTTGRKLRQAGYSALNFEGHVPYPVEKAWLAGALRFDYGAGAGMTLFSTILNCAQVEAAHINSQRIRGWLGGPLTSEQIASKLATNQFACSTNDLTLPGLMPQIEALFPEPCPWEIDQVLNRG